jgi:hypothetical protein
MECISKEVQMKVLLAQHVLAEGKGSLDAADPFPCSSVWHKGVQLQALARFLLHFAFHGLHKRTCAHLQLDNAWRLWFIFRVGQNRIYVYTVHDYILSPCQKHRTSVFLFWRRMTSIDLKPLLFGRGGKT